MTFFEKIVGWIKVHFKNAPAIAVQVSSTVNYVVPFVEELDVLVAPEVALVVNPVLDSIKVGLAALSLTIKDSTTATGQSNITSILSSLQKNASSLESAFKVKDAGSQQKATAIISLIAGEVSAIQAQFSTVTTSAPVVPVVVPVVTAAK